MVKKKEPIKKNAVKPKKQPKAGNGEPKPWQFQKGESGNPLGAKLHDPEIKQLKSLTKKELVEIGNLIIKGNIADLKAVSKAETSTVLHTMLASVAARIISKGDMAALDVLLNRLVGKVKDEVHHGGEVRLPQVVISLPSNRKEAV